MIYRLFRITAAGCAALAAACATLPPLGPPAGPSGRVEPPQVGLFSKIKVPDGVEPVLRLTAKGVQVFRCEARRDGQQWVFRLPEAELFDSGGQVVAHHGANFSFEHDDGSRLLGTVAAFDEAPQGGNLRWLLLTTRAFGQGAFTGVTYVQRVNTVGGMPPPRCDVVRDSLPLRVNFMAEFVFYRPRPS